MLKNLIRLGLICWIVSACAVDAVEEGEVVIDEPAQEENGSGGGQCTQNITCPSPGPGYMLSADYYVGSGCISCFWIKYGAPNKITGACTTCPLPVSCSHAASCPPSLPCTTWTCTSV